MNLFIGLHSGPPLPPAPAVMVHNATLLQLSWDPPFVALSKDYPILYYNVTATYTDTGNIVESLLEREPNGTVEQYGLPSITRTCWYITFNVSATSAIGTSGNGSTEGGFPMRKLLIHSHIKSILHVLLNY